MVTVHRSYDELFSLYNLFCAWKKFRRGKTRKKDILDYELHLEDSLFNLYETLHQDIYEHSAYQYFQIFDNKKRNISKAVVRDRIIHQIVYDYLSEIFEPDFISDSYASRLNKGSYKALGALQYFIKLNYYSQKTCFILKFDVKKYFDNINHEILLRLIKARVTDDKVFSIIQKIIKSYSSGGNRGIPLGNITSQIFANIYLNQLDHFVKKELGCRFYVRYNDDFVIVSESSCWLEEIRSKIIIFVEKELSLSIPIEKTSLRKITWGVDFLGFTILPRAVLLRNKTKSKIFSDISLHNIHSYFGILKHCNSYNLRQKILSMDKFGMF